MKSRDFLNHGVFEITGFSKSRDFENHGVLKIAGFRKSRGFENRGVLKITGFFPLHGACIKGGNIRNKVELLKEHLNTVIKRMNDLHKWMDTFIDKDLRCHDEFDFSELSDDE